MSSRSYPSLAPVLTTNGPFTDETFIPGPQVAEFLESVRVLVIGAGGLGCEILKNLALSGFLDIHVIDMDTIDISNLNRQFLFRESDIGKSKAETAARFIEKRLNGRVKITPHFKRIQEMDLSFYKSFAIIVCGLDSVEARRWISATLVNMVDDEDPSSLKILIDGGTEGFKGQSRVIVPTVTSCYECSLEMLGVRETFPICTIANTPRLPEHCIEWASMIEWPRVFKAMKQLLTGKDTKLDTDNYEHLEWLYKTSKARAEEFGITGVTFSLTMGVVKNIIPAIASTNAIIAASCCNEALKIATSCNPYLNNYMMYSGNESVFTYTFEYMKKDDCPVCGNLAKPLTVSPDLTLQEFIYDLSGRQETAMRAPSLRTASRSLYIRSPAQLEEATRPNLAMRLGDLVSDGEEVVVTDASLPLALRLLLKYEEQHP